MFDGLDDLVGITDVLLRAPEERPAPCEVGGVELTMSVTEGCGHAVVLLQGVSPHVGAGWSGSINEIGIGQGRSSMRSGTWSDPRAYFEAE